jgi:calcineurin-like phosphoesterase family protein
MNYYSADSHYSHKNIIKYENRPFKTVDEMDDYMIYKHNQKVKAGDNVYFLGDFAFASPERIKEILLRLNGNKYLIYGNHDKTIKQNRELQQLFVWCKDYQVVYEKDTPVILFHYPIQVWDRKHHGSIHLYGHVHSNKDNHHPIVNDPTNAYNVGVDVRGFAPVSLGEILKK